MTIDAAFRRFWEEKGQHDADSRTTLERMGTLQDGFTERLRERGRAARLAEIDAEVIADYVARRRGTISRAKKLLSPASVNRELQILRRILRRAARVWRMPIVLPAWDELMLPEADERVVDISRDLEAKILAQLRPDFVPAAEFLTLSGLRAGNALPLHPSCIDFEQGLMTVKQKSRKPGGKTHVLPITSRMQVLLANAIGHDPDAVFTYVAQRTRAGRVRGQRYPLTPETFYNAFKAAAKAVGQPDLRPHDLRHVAGTRTLRASGGNLRAAQRHLGHARIATTTKYAHYLLDELREAMEAAHSPEKNPEAAASKERKLRAKRQKSA
ncbi:tyrosine-type recombinase/integrase [Xanthobacter autotrophicus]|uniref:tyrosine-type recombinase/integrase n=1 Tax=Xanthobacter autotrophicus TaxID=280 RepID=UPI00372A7570